MPRRFPGRIVRHPFVLLPFTICLLLLVAAGFGLASWAVGFAAETGLVANARNRSTLLSASLRKPRRKMEREAIGNQTRKLRRDNFPGADPTTSADFTLQQKLTQAVGEGVVDDQFGVAVAVSGNTAVIGAYNANVEANMDQGAVYVFTGRAGVWSQQQKLTASDGAAGDGFGVSVAIHGDTLIVGAYADDAGSGPDEADRGSAYVFTRSGDLWSEQQKLTLAGTDGAGGDLFGFAVSLNGDTAVIGSPMDDGMAPDGGAAYVFTRSGTVWTQQQKLLANNSGADDAFGVCAAIEGNTAVIGALRHDVASNSNQGAAYIFNRSGLSWSQGQQLAAEDGTANDQFGVSVSISGSSVIVGANFKDTGPNLGQGAAYVFTEGDTWKQQQKLLAADGSHDDAFGTSVAISGDTAVVGSSDDDLATFNQGSVYTFTRSGSAWTQDEHLSPDDGAESDFFASNVAIDGSTIVAGAPQGNVGANHDQGAAYVFNATTSVAINDVSVDEVNTGTTVVTFIVSLTPANNQEVTVQFATADGTATAGTDYVAATGVVTFPPGHVTQLISIDIIGDVLTEVDETFSLNLSNPTNTMIGDTSGTATIQDNDPNASLPSAFVETQITGLSEPTAMAQAPDGRIFVCQQGGALRVIKNGALLPTPFLNLTVSSVGERGLLGVAFDPAFNSNQFVYVYYTATTPAIHNRVSRFTANGDVAVPGSEVVILDLNNLSGATNHNGGAIHFGPDGKLYVGVGENANAANAQSFGNLLGKMLRINTDPANLIPADNPYFNDPNVTGNNRAIWALGLRNPFTFGFQPGTGRLFINDVGQNAWEEINEGLPHANYGWPTCEGPSCSANPPSDYQAPVYVYNHSSDTPTGCAIVGGAFYNPPVLQFPARYIGKYFFADLCSGFIRYIDPTTTPPIPSSTGFATGISTPVDLLVGDDGSLFYLTRGSGGSVFRVQYTGGSTIAINDVSVAEGNTGMTTANFTVTLSPASSQTVTVQYATADGSATAGNDYLNATGTITFMPGETSQQVGVTVNGDTTLEPNETFFIDLSAATNATIDDNQGQGTIVNDDLTPPTFEFAQANFAHNESSQSVTVTVRRTGNPVPAATIDFKTNSDLTFIECSLVTGQANQRCDYLLTSGTLSFASNELEKSFNIVTFNDAFVEGNETFSIDLSNPTGGAVVGSLATAVVTIADDDLSPPTTNPIDSSRYFVRQNYYDFLQRVPDQGGEDFWVGQIDGLCAPGDAACINRRRVAVSAAFFVSSEFTRSGGYVYRLYKAAFGEQTLYRPLYSQFSSDRGRVVDGADLEQGKLDLANLFVQRNEFTTRYPQKTPDAFVDAILQTVQQGSEVTFNATERQNFINDVTTGGRGLMLKNLGDNAAFTEAVFNRAFVLMQYFGYLRRDPDQGGYDFWLGILDAAAQNFDAMVCAFITSPEYQRRFSPVVTRTDATCQ